MYDKVLAIDEYGNKIIISKEEYKTGKYKKMECRNALSLRFEDYIGKEWRSN